MNKSLQLICFILNFFLFLICSPLLKQLMTHYRVLKDKGVYVLVIAPLYLCGLNMFVVLQLGCEIKICFRLKLKLEHIYLEVSLKCSLIHHKNLIKLNQENYIY